MEAYFFSATHPIRSKLKNGEITRQEQIEDTDSSFGRAMTQ